MSSSPQSPTGHTSSAPADSGVAVAAPTVQGQTQTPSAMNGPSGITIPQWLVQLIPLLVLLFGAATVYATQKADVDQLKASLVEIKIKQDQQAQNFVSRQVFEVKMMEADKNQAKLDNRLDRIETLINGIYDRLPSKHDK